MILKKMFAKWEIIQTTTTATTQQNIKHKSQQWLLLVIVVGINPNHSHICCTKWHKSKLTNHLLPYSPLITKELKTLLTWPSVAVWNMVTAQDSSSQLLFSANLGKKVEDCSHVKKESLLKLKWQGGKCSQQPQQLDSWLLNRRRKNKCMLRNYLRGVSFENKRQTFAIPW